MNELIDAFNTYRALLQQCAAILLGVAIWRWGAGPERWLIGVFLTTMILPIYVIWSLQLGAAEIGPYAGVLFLIDVIAAAAYTAIALNANRNYPLWIAGFQLVSVVAHVVRSVIDTVSPFAYAVLIIGPSYGALVVLAVGFLRHIQRERRFGEYREWRNTPPGLRWLRP